MALGSTQPLTEMSTRSISWGGKGGRCVRLTTYHHPVPLSRNLGNLTSWNPLGLSRPVMGLLYLFFYLLHFGTLSECATNHSLLPQLASHSVCLVSAHVTVTSHKFEVSAGRLCSNRELANDQTADITVCMWQFLGTWIGLYHKCTSIKESRCGIKLYYLSHLRSAQNREILFRASVDGFPIPGAAYKLTLFLSDVTCRAVE